MKPADDKQKEEDMNNVCKQDICPLTAHPTATGITTCHRTRAQAARYGYKTTGTLSARWAAGVVSSEPRKGDPLREAWSFCLS